MKKNDKAAIYMESLLEGMNLASESMTPLFEAFSDETIPAESIEDFWKHYEVARADLKERFPSYEELLDFVARKEAGMQNLHRTLSTEMIRTMGIMQSKLESPELMSALDDVKGRIGFQMSNMKDAFESVALSVGRSLAAAQYAKAKQENKRALAVNGSDGGRLRAGKFDPVKQIAFSLARSGKYKSALDAATKLAPEIRKTPEFESAGLSEARLIQTLADWFRVEKIVFSKPKKTA